MKMYRYDTSDFYNDLGYKVTAFTNLVWYHPLNIMLMATCRFQKYLIFI